MVTLLDEPAQLPLAMAYASSKKRLLLLDYDGTLVDYTPTPDKAAPTSAVLELIANLAADTKNKLVIISGRPHHTLDNWFEQLVVNLVAEHGAFNKVGAVWEPSGQHNTDWKTPVEPIMEQATKASPGMFVEQKITALVLHYRNAKKHAVALKATRQAKTEILKFAKQLNLKVTHADEALEVRPLDISKGKNALNWLRADRYDFVLAAGDSVTDEDMFELLPSTALTIKVGEGKTSARYRVVSPGSFVKLLSRFSSL